MDFNMFKMPDPMVAGMIQNILEETMVITQSCNSEYVMGEHVLLAIMNKKKNGYLKFCANRKGVTFEDIKNNIRDYVMTFSNPNKKNNNLGYTMEVVTLLTKSITEAERFGITKLDSPEIFLVGFLVENNKETSLARKVLDNLGCSIAELQDYLNNNITVEVEEDYVADKEIIGEFCEELVEHARNGKIDNVIGREEEVERLIKTLNRRRKSNAVLVGEPGVGKTAVVEGLAVKIAKGEVPDCLKDYRIYTLSITNMVAGARFRGDFEERLRDVIEEFKKDKHCLIFFDEIHTVMGSGTGSRQEGLDGANILKPALSRGEIRCIGATTYDEYRNVFLKDKAFARRFQKVDVNEPDDETTFNIIRQSYHYYEDHHNVSISDEVIRHAIKLSNLYLHDRFQPDKTFDIIDEAGSAYRTGYNKGKEITSEDVEKVICKWTNRPSVSLENDEKQNLSSLESNLKSSVFGQDEIIEKMVKAIKFKKAGLNKKVLSAFFAGPSGVGKTELARKIAENLNMNFLKFDMSEYSTEIDVTKLNGVAPGYVGFDQAGALTEEIIKHPNSVVLLDEIEKAHPKIYNMFLQVMDDSVMTDNNNRKADFKNVILIMTSNTGCGEANKKSTGLGFEVDKNFKNEKKQNFIENEMKKTFTPEFRNRITCSFVFNDLDEKSMGLVVDKFLKQLNDSLAEKEVSIKLTNNMRKFLIEKSMEQNMGGRPVERILNEYVSEKLIDEILFGKLANGGNVTVDYKNENVKFNYEVKTPVF
jgi:ATP-dependent Clp protease ATP-binding subunit ClpA